MNERLCLLSCVGALSLTIGLAACVPAAKSPPPSAAPAPQPGPTPATPPPPPSATGWEDAPITPGDWTYAKEAGGSVARFGSPSTGVPLSLRCDAPNRRLILARAGASADSAPSLVIRTTYGAVAWPAVQVAGAQPSVQASRLATDPSFDQIAYSRGRFAVEGGGLPRIIAPSWAEVVRVIEDCRG